MSQYWKRLFFKAGFMLGLLILEQLSFFVAEQIIYGKRFIELSLTHYLYCQPVMIIVSILMIDYYKMANFQHKSVLTDLIESFRFVLIFTSIICIYAYIFNLYALPRYVLVLGGFFFYIVMFLWITLFKRISFRIYQKDSLLVIASTEEEANKIMAKIRYELKSLNLKLVGWITPQHVLEENEIFLSTVGILMSDRVDEQDKNAILLQCSNMKKFTYILPSFYDLAFSKYKIVKFYDTPTFLVENNGLTMQQRLLKRIFDVVFSFLVLLVASPVFLLIAILIKLDSKGPVFYTQERVTFEGKPYHVLKFRSMVHHAEQLFGAYQSSADDNRVTRMGRILRNTHLDELPQFWNVLFGSMSVVGPRSDRTITLDLLEKQTTGYNYRLKVKSGITGLAQLFGKYNSDPEDKLRYDIYYIKNYSLLLDLQIIIMTISTILPKADNFSQEKTDSDYYIFEKSKS